jgi:hypothetical protein
MIIINYGTIYCSLNSLIPDSLNNVIYQQLSIRDKDFFWKQRYIENILKKLKADSKKGVEIVYCFGLCDDDDYETGDCETVYGKEYLERTDYYELKKELKRRRINLRRKK